MIFPLAAGAWTLLDPWLLLLGAPALGVLLWRLRRERAALPIASLAPLHDLPRTLRQRLVQLPLLLHGVAALGFVLALARPVAREVMPLRELGVDILLIVDRSSSMLSPDMDARGTTRMQAARDNAIAFAKARTTDRVGLLTFARYPELTCPLTLDQDALAAFLRGVETVPPRSAEDGTAIGVALAQVSQTLAPSKATSKVAVLLSDGEQTVHDIGFEDGAKLCADAGVRVHTIGIGSGEQTMLGMQELSFEALRKAAEVTKGKFFRARSAADLAEVYAEIDALEKIELDDPRYRTTDYFHWPLLLGALCIALGLVLESTWLRRLP